MVFCCLFNKQNTLSWYLLLNIGSCSNQLIYDIKQCKNANYLWSGFDISGHCFLLLHSSLLLLEEISPLLLQNHTAKSNRNFKRNIVSFGGVLLVFLWYVLLLSTCFYFHTILEIYAGSVLGFGYWGLMYVKNLYKPSRFYRNYIR